MDDKNVGDWISAGPGEEGVNVVGVDGDNNRNRESESPAVRAREFDQAATKPLPKGFVIFSDAVDSNRANDNYCLHEEYSNNNKPMLVTESPSDCLSTGS